MPRRARWPLIGRCNDGRLSLDQLDELYEHDREISYETFARKVDIEALAELLGYAYGSHQRGVHLSKDRYVHFYRSQLNGQTCYHMDWSAIDHVFQAPHEGAQMFPTPSAVAVLQTFGWTPCVGGSAIASKSYDTAVGPKTAHVYASGVTLSGDYVSEGRNVLSGCCKLLPQTDDADVLREAITEFALAADHAVHESYAARLLRRFPETFNRNLNLAGAA